MSREHSRVLTTKYAQNQVALFRHIYEILATPTDASTKLPYNSPFPFNDAYDFDWLVQDVWLSPRGDGIVLFSSPRGFMAGMGTTYHYYLLIDNSICITTQDWWEDNIADPEEFDFHVRATSAEALERAVKVLTEYWNDLE